MNLYRNQESKQKTFCDILVSGLNLTHHFSYTTAFQLNVGLKKELKKACRI